MGADVKGKECDEYIPGAKARFFAWAWEGRSGGLRPADQTERADGSAGRAVPVFSCFERLPGGEQSGDGPAGVEDRGSATTLETDTRGDLPPVSFEILFDFEGGHAA